MSSGSPGGQLNEENPKNKNNKKKTEQNKTNPIFRGETRPGTNTQATSLSLKGRVTLWVVIILQLNSDYHMGKLLTKRAFICFRWETVRFKLTEGFAASAGRWWQRKAALIITFPFRFLMAQSG